MITVSNSSAALLRRRRSRVCAGAGIVGAAVLLATVSPQAAYPSSDPDSVGVPRHDVPGSTERDPDARPFYVIPGGCVAPESVAVYGGKYYTGGVCNGRLYVGDLRRKRAHSLVPSGPRHIVVGGIEATANRLVVAKGGSGFAKVYNRFTGEQLARFSNGLPQGRGIVNDVAITPHGDAYLTEFSLSKIYRIPAAGIAQPEPAVQELPVWLNLRGTVFPIQGGSANGIAATPDGRFLIVAHYAAGELYRVRIRDQQVTKIRLHGKHLDGPDGIELSNADVLYVVEQQRQRIAEIRLSNHYDHGRVVSRTTSPRFHCPSGVALAGDRLLVSNLGNGCPFKLPWTVASIPIP